VDNRIPDGIPTSTTPPAKPARGIEPPAGKLLLTIPEVVYLTGYSDRQLRALIAQGKLRNCSMDRTVRIRREDVARLIDGRPPRR
jgi:excisionase family DNA binding protein